ncbi:hypothetical protein H6501_01560 [Candidatus Woesearchaeota archaeon]|nr:hypothetical protein [Candidatus Woesearchaeota archaeon]USN44786.1 MAG: hypothetical protein H6500_03005 [Candidatus Woesearchaeota archaeon]
MIVTPKTSALLNRNIPELAYLYSRPLVDLLLYGNISGLNLNSASLEALTTSRKIQASLYSSIILPDLSEIFSFFLGKPYSYHFKEDSPNVTTIGEFRDILRRAYMAQHSPFSLESVTKNALMNTCTLKKNTLFPPYYYDKKQQHLISHREKTIKSKEKKYQDTLQEIEQNGKEALFEKFLIELCTTRVEFFSEEGHPHFLQFVEGDKSLFRPLLCDDKGARLIVLQTPEANKILETTLQKKTKTVGKFGILPDLTEDHRDRRLEERPGGIHMTFYLKGRNLPFEVQVRTLEDAILALVGPHCDALYAASGKKTNPHLRH